MLLFPFRPSSPQRDFGAHLFGQCHWYAALAVSLIPRQSAATRPGFRRQTYARALATSAFDHVALRSRRPATEAGAARART